MKAAFYYSQDCALAQVRRPKFSILTIDGLRFTESVIFEDDEEIKPYSSWEDNILVAVVEDVTLMEYGGFKSLSYEYGSLKNRITVNGKIQ